jgi:hypothetical protein
MKTETNITYEFYTNSNLIGTKTWPGNPAPILEEVMQSKV